MSAACSTCGAPIVWVVMEGGKRMPVDVVSVEKRIVLDGKRERGAIMETWISHFASCPQAAQHRRKE